jgi:hypothetical protein
LTKLVAVEEVAVVNEVGTVVDATEVASRLVEVPDLVIVLHTFLSFAVPENSAKLSWDNLYWSRD